MDSKTFTENALKTESFPETVAVAYPAVATALEIAIAAGNVADRIKKAVFYGKPIDGDGLAGDLVALSLHAATMGVMNRENRLLMAEPLSVGSDAGDIRDLRVLHGTIGMFTESAEMIAALKKRIAAHGVELDIANLCEEIGDSDWYKAILHDALDIPEEQIRETVIAKLRKRYRGKFDADAAINRDLEGERKILEEGVKR